MVIEPGDLMLGDNDGLVCIPFASLDEVLAAARKKHEAEVAQMAAIEAETSNRKWVDQALGDSGCEIVE